MQYPVREPGAPDQVVYLALLKGLLKGSIGGSRRFKKDLRGEVEDLDCFSNFFVVFNVFSLSRVVL